MLVAIDLFVVLPILTSIAVTAAIAASREAARCAREQQH